MSEDTVAVGKEVAEAVLVTWRSAGRPLPLELESVAKWVSLPKEPHGEETLTRLETEATTGGASGAAASYWLARLKEGSAGASVYLTTIGLFTLGPGCRIAWIAGEPLSQWQPFLREELNDPGLILWGYIGMGGRYLLLDHHLAEGGYEVHSAHFGRIAPEPLAVGLNEAIGRGFQELQKRLCERQRR